MSALRLSVPGQPTILVDLGPSVGRRTHTRGAVMGGALVSPVTKKNRANERLYRITHQEQVNEQRRASRARVKARKA